ncbi:hypothetical protein EGR_10453 [Echinococcus granulosus]|uniref:Uncharacterized protein n=1 Tax=Echinococcus granulosus TaxID=6210 RepID=W6U2B4_ECHGR|nr:hypothetical protein EGR_10453 [Echinococcus granulosus]EUB54691.1 hypothetical protein EGR_10453 [Echinococcus granulosus]
MASVFHTFISNSAFFLPWVTIDLVTNGATQNPFDFGYVLRRLYRCANGIHCEHGGIVRPILLAKALTNADEYSKITNGSTKKKTSSKLELFGNCKSLIKWIEVIQTFFFNFNLIALLNKVKMA